VQNCKVGITGATGLVGQALVEELCKDFQVVAIARNAALLDNLVAYTSLVACIPVECRLTDITDLENLSAAFAGLDVVIHAAGFVDPLAKREAIFAINVGGTDNALKAAALNGLKQFIQISSLSVITGQGDQFNLDESAPLQLCGEAYADSKVEAEKLVCASKIPYTILRPGFIYGPHERSWLPRVSRAIASGQAMLVDGGIRETNVVYVGNLCSAVKGAILNEKAYNQVFNITDGEKVTKKELFDAIADGLGLTPMLPTASQSKLARFSPAAFRLAAVNQGFSIAKAERILDYNSSKRLPFKEGMAVTMKSFTEKK